MKVLARSFKKVKKDDQINKIEDEQSDSHTSER